MIQKPVKKNREVPNPSNTTKADVNEILFGYFVKPGTKANPFSGYSNQAEVEKAYKDKAEQLPYDFWYMEMRRAEEMAKEFIKYAKQHGYGTKIKEIVWTARNGSMTDAVGYPVPQKGTGKNPSDVLVCFSNPKSRGSGNKTKKGCSWLGVSAKSTAKFQDIGFANPGLGVISQDLFKNKSHLPNIVEKCKDKFTDKYTELKGKSNVDIKKILKQNDALKVEARAAGLECLQQIRNEMIGKVVKMEYHEWQDFMMDFVQATFEGPHYIKLTGQGAKEPFKAVLEDPIVNKKTRGIKGPQVLLEESGDTSINVYSYEDKPLFKIRMKWESSPLSSTVKLSGDPL